VLGILNFVLFLSVLTSQQMRNHNFSYCFFVLGFLPFTRFLLDKYYLFILCICAAVLSLFSYLRHLLRFYWCSHIILLWDMCHCVIFCMYLYSQQLAML